MKKQLTLEDVRIGDVVETRGRYRGVVIEHDGLTTLHTGVHIEHGVSAVCCVTGVQDYVSLASIRTVSRDTELIWSKEEK